MIKIRNIHHDNKNELEEIMDLIYNVFFIKNIQDTTKNICEKYEKLFGPKRDLEYTASLFRKSNIFFVAVEEDKIVGIVRGRKDKIINLYVDVNYQGQGIGKNLVRKFERKAHILGSEKIILKPSKYAINFYLNEGFKRKDEKYLEKEI